MPKRPGDRRKTKPKPVGSFDQRPLFKRSTGQVTTSERVGAEERRRNLIGRRSNRDRRQNQLGTKVSGGIKVSPEEFYRVPGARQVTGYSKGADHSKDYNVFEDRRKQQRRQRKRRSTDK